MRKEEKDKAQKTKTKFMPPPQNDTGIQYQVRNIYRKKTDIF